MSGPAIVLAAHGSDVEPSVNAQIRECAAAVALRGAFTEVAVALHRGNPSFAHVLDQLQANEVVVVPLMTSIGYYSEVVLPRELAANTTYATKRVHVTRPIGIHPGISSIVADRVRDRMRAYGLAGNETTLALIGHGTPRHGRSRDATLELADRVVGYGLCATVRVAFLDDEPPIERLLVDLATPNLVVGPFLISDGPHTTRDIPRRLKAGASTQDWEFIIEDVDEAAGASGRRTGAVRVILDSAVGTDPRMVDLILDLAQRALRRPVEVSS